MILFHSSDLIWATKIKGTADAIGVAARPVRTLEMLEARLADSDVTAVVVDLEAPDVALALIRHLRRADRGAREHRIRVLAYGPHVATDEFELARRAGADHVVARGAFNARMSSILSDLATPVLKPPTSGGSTETTG